MDASFVPLIPGQHAKVVHTIENAVFSYRYMKNYAMLSACDDE